MTYRKIITVKSSGRRSRANSNIAFVPLHLKHNVIQRMHKPHCHRATLCVSAVLDVGQCPSVCPSFLSDSLYCILTAEDVMKVYVNKVAPSF